MSAVADFFDNIEFYDVIDILVEGGWYHYLFPFLLVYAIVLTILNRAKIFEKSKPTRVIIALVFALFSIAFPITDSNCYASGYSGITPGCTLGDFMVVLFPGVTAFTIGVLALYIVAAMMGVDLMRILGDDENKQQVMKYVLGVLGALVVIYYYAKGFGWEGLNSNFWLWELLQDPFLYIIIIFGLVFFWVSKDGGEESSDEGEKKVFEEKH